MDRIGRTVQPEQDSQNGASRTVQDDCLHRTSRTGLLGQESQSRAAGTGQPEKESQDCQDCQDMSAEQLWALEPGFQCNAATGEKSANSHFFLSRSGFSLFPLTFSSRPRAVFLLCSDLNIL